MNLRKQFFLTIYRGKYDCDFSTNLRFTNDTVSLYCQKTNGK